MKHSRICLRHWAWSRADGPSETRDRGVVNTHLKEDLSPSQFQLSDAPMCAVLSDYAASLRRSDSLAWSKYIKKFKTSEREGHQMGRRCYAHFLQMMIQYRRTNIAEAIYSDLRHGGKHFPAALRHHNLMLGMYADMKDEDGQRAVLERMDASGVECNIFSFTSIVKCPGQAWEA